MVECRIWVALLTTLTVAALPSGRTLGAQGSTGPSPVGAAAGASRGADTRAAARTPLQPWEWWNDADVKKQLGLGDDRVKKIDDFYQARAKALQPFVDEFIKQSAELDKMTRAAVANEATYSLQVWRVESLRSKLSESRTMMLYRISQQLQPEQLKKLQDIIDARYNRNRGRGPEPGR